MIKIFIDKKEISSNSEIFLIAEAGVNHNGDFLIAKKMIDVASNAKVDAIKFQTFTAENLMLKSTPKAQYQKTATGNDKNLYEMIKKYEFSKEIFRKLKNYCSEKGLIFLSTPFDKLSVDWLEELNVPCYKVGSGDLNNFPLLNYICSKRKPILLSTGMSTLEEVKATVIFIKSNKIEDIVIFQCTSNYPTKFEDLNLNVIDTYKIEFPNEIIGFSDHSSGVEASIGAAAKGVKVIEKHFTLDKNLEGPDHKASLNPEELIEWVNAIRIIEKALGSSIKELSKKEEEIAKIARKSVVSVIKLNIGDNLTEENICVKRPGIGISAKDYYNIIGKKVKKNILKDTIIHWEDLE